MHPKADNERQPPSPSAAGTGEKLNPAELKIDLLCNGLRLDPAKELPSGSRPFPCAPAGLGSGLELIIPADRRELWVNAPVTEKFVEQSPYLLVQSNGLFQVIDERKDLRYQVALAPKPAWYDARTSGGAPMARVGSLHGSCLSIYIGDRCHFWTSSPGMRCRFCNLGLDPGTAEQKTVEDVVETASAAREQSKATLVLLNSGYQGAQGLAKVFPYVEALKKRAGLLVAVQFIPEKELSLYDEVIGLGVDHISFCFEFYNAEYFSEYLPGKAKEIGRRTFFRALEYCSRRLGRGRVSGELVAGIEPLQDTLRAIDYIGYVGAYPVVCVFRPLAGADLEKAQPPRFADMVRVFRHVYKTCKAHKLPIGIAPNIHYSLSLQPEDAFCLAPQSGADRSYRRWLWAVRMLMRPHFLRRTTRG